MPRYLLFLDGQTKYLNVWWGKRWNRRKSSSSSWFGFAKPVATSSFLLYTIADTHVVSCSKRESFFFGVKERGGGLGRWGGGFELLCPCVSGSDLDDDLHRPCAFPNPFRLCRPNSRQGEIRRIKFFFRFVRFCFYLFIFFKRREFQEENRRDVKNKNIFDPTPHFKSITSLLFFFCNAIYRRFLMLFSLRDLYYYGT